MFHPLDSFVKFINRFEFKIDYSFAESNDAYTHFRVIIKNLSDQSSGHFYGKVFRD